jgi:hypothetical protein
MPGRRLGGVGLAMECLNAHPLHQRGNLQAANGEPFVHQQVSQHPEDSACDEPSLAAPVGGEHQICWCAGSDDGCEHNLAGAA